MFNCRSRLPHKNKPPHVHSSDDITWGLKKLIVLISSEYILFLSLSLSLVFNQIPSSKTFSCNLQQEVGFVWLNTWRSFVKKTLKVRFNHWRFAVITWSVFNNDIHVFCRTENSWSSAIFYWFQLHFCASCDVIDSDTHQEGFHKFIWQ